jgi:hypothetical protein
MLRCGDASDIYVGAAASRGVGDLWHPQTIAGTRPRQVETVVNFLFRFPNGHEPQTRECLREYPGLICLCQLHCESQEHKSFVAWSSRGPSWTNARWTSVSREYLSGLSAERSR